VWPLLRRGKCACERRRSVSLDVRSLLLEAVIAPTARIPRAIRARRDARDLVAAAHRYFDAAHYLASFDGFPTGEDAFERYMRVGARAGRSPNPTLGTLGYAYDHPDIADHGGNALLHWLTVGRRAAATPHPLFGRGGTSGGTWTCVGRPSNRSSTASGSGETSDGRRAPPWMRARVSQTHASPCATIRVGGHRHHHPGVPELRHDVPGPLRCRKWMTRLCGWCMPRYPVAAAQNAKS
jgi:hypothetical protein